MKRILTSVVLLAGMTSVCLWSISAVNSGADRMLDEISEIKREYSGGGDTAETAEALQKEWNSFQKKAVLVNDPDLAADIAASVAEIYAYAGQGSDEVLTACARAEAQIKLLKDAQTPTVQKIL